MIVGFYAFTFFLILTVTLSLYSFSISSSRVVRAGNFNKRFLNAPMYLFDIPKNDSENNSDCFNYTQFT